MVSIVQGVRYHRKPPPYCELGVFVGVGAEVPTGEGPFATYCAAARLRMRVEAVKEVVGMRPWIQEREREREREGEREEGA